MTFNPQESIDFNGNTGPFIQYSYARIQSILRKAKAANIKLGETVLSEYKISEKEKSLIKLLHEYPQVIKLAAENLSPAQIANYTYELAKEFNQFYHEFPILVEENASTRVFRLELSKFIGETIKSGLNLLGIDVVERM